MDIENKYESVYCTSSCFHALPPEKMLYTPCAHEWDAVWEAEEAGGGGDQQEKPQMEQVGQCQRDLPAPVCLELLLPGASLTRETIQ